MKAALKWGMLILFSIAWYWIIGWIFGGSEWKLTDPTDGNHWPQLLLMIIGVVLGYFTVYALLLRHPETRKEYFLSWKKDFLILLGLVTFTFMVVLFD